MYFKKLYQFRSPDNLSLLFFAILTFFTIHMLVEGYVLASGSFMFFYLWLFLGVIKNRIEFQKVFVYL